MKVELLVSAWCNSCRQAEQVWQQVSTEKQFDYAVLDATQPEGRALISRLRLKTVPALVIDGELRGLGVPTIAEAREWVSQAPARRTDQKQNTGLLLSNDNRWFAVLAVIYLLFAGLGLALQGSLLSDSTTRPVALHFMTIGFFLMLVYGLGAHMLPRFTGQPIRVGHWPWLQMALANLGLWGYVSGFWFAQPTLIVFGGTLVWLSLGLFTWRIWPVLWPKDQARG